MAFGALQRTFARKPIVWTCAAVVGLFIAFEVTHFEHQPADPFEKMAAAAPSKIRLH